jgi:hypothetical protein
MGVLVSLYYAIAWMPLRVAQRDVIGWSVSMSGHNTIAFDHEGSPAIQVEGKTYFYTAECTYLDLVMMVTPFLWVFGASLRRNILRIAITTLVMLSANFVRCWAAVYLDMLGVDRFYAHDLPDYIIWWPTVGMAVLLALRRDFGTSFGSRRMGPIVASAGLGSGNACS